MSSKVDSVHTFSRPEGSSQSLSRGRQVKHGVTTGTGLSDQSQVPKSETTSKASERLIPPHWGRELYTRLAALDEDESDDDVSASGSNASHGRANTPRMLDASSKTSADDNDLLSPTKGVEREEASGDGESWVDEEGSVDFDEERDAANAVVGTQGVQDQGQQSLDQSYDPIRDGTPPASVKCSHRLPIDWNSAHVTDKMIIIWKEQGLSWSQIDLKWLELTGRPIKPSWLSNRFQRIKGIKKAVLNDKRSMTSHDEQQNNASSTEDVDHVSGTIDPQCMDRRDAAQASAQKPRRSTTMPANKYVAHKLGSRPRRYCSFCTISTEHRRWERHIQSSRHRRKVLSARDKLPDGANIAHASAHMSTTQRQSNTHNIFRERQSSEAMQQYSGQLPATTPRTIMLLSAKKRRCGLCGVTVLRDKFRQHEDTLKHQVKLIDMACKDSQAVSEHADNLREKSEERALLETSLSADPTYERCDVCNTSQLTRWNYIQHLRGAKHRVIMSANKGEKLKYQNDKTAELARRPNGQVLAATQRISPRCEAHNSCAEAQSNPSQLVRVVSEFFGPGDHSAYSFPEDVWLLWCPKHIDQAQKDGSWHMTQHGLLVEQLIKIEDRGLLRSWVITLKAKTIERLQAEDRRILTGLPIKLGSERACWERFLVPHLGPKKSFLEVREFLTLILQQFEYGGLHQHGPRINFFPGIELRPKFRADHGPVRYILPSVMAPGESSHSLPSMQPGLSPNDTVESRPEEPLVPRKRLWMDQESTGSGESTMPGVRAGLGHDSESSTFNRESRRAYETHDMVFEAQEYPAQKRRKQTKHNESLPRSPNLDINREKWVTIPCKKKHVASRSTAPSNETERPPSLTTIGFNIHAQAKSRFSLDECRKMLNHKNKNSANQQRPWEVIAKECGFNAPLHIISEAFDQYGFPSILSGEQSPHTDQQKVRANIIDLEEDDSTSEMDDRSDLFDLATELSALDQAKKKASSAKDTAQAIRTPHGTIVSPNRLKQSVSMKKAWAKRQAEGRSGRRGGAPIQKHNRQSIQSGGASDVNISPQAQRYESSFAMTAPSKSDPTSEQARGSAPTLNEDPFMRPAVLGPEQARLDHSDQEHLATEISKASRKEKNRRHVTKDKDFASLPDYAPSTANLPNDTIILRTNWRPAYGPLDLSRDMRRSKLHKAEVKLAATLRLNCATYLCTKRRIFEAHRESRRMNKAFTKIQAQRACRISTTKAAELWTVFNRAGWFNQTYFFKPNRQDRVDGRKYIPDRPARTRHLPYGSQASPTAQKSSTRASTHQRSTPQTMQTTRTSPGQASISGNPPTDRSSAASSSHTQTSAAPGPAFLKPGFFKPFAGHAGSKPPPYTCPAPALPGLPTFQPIHYNPKMPQVLKSTHLSKKMT